MTTEVRRGIDWGQFWCPGRRDPFTADEMARAGSDPPSPTLIAVTCLNVALVAFVVLQAAPAAQTARLAAALAALVAGCAWAARWLWWRPWRRPLTIASIGMGFGLLVVLLGASARIRDRTEAYAVVFTLALCGVVAIVLLTLLVLWRAQQIEGRLREQAERAKAIEMARRLASAQVEPHFLFNTLASVQHWVQTRDARAAPMLEALTGYLRATLPLFDRPLLPAADELRAVERYLQVMQARLGAERLQWRVEVEKDASRAQLPPGLLLTLVENAVTHGIEPQLRGGSVVVRGARRGDDVVFEVDDNGPGPGAEASDGTGLANVRQRLALHAGERATLRVARGPAGGCTAEIRLPWTGAGEST
ncbi:MAG TPA: histidine kinase [Caldimonas sp.]|nr:histidine kinase [Caldimonas sp.]